MPLKKNVRNEQTFPKCELVWFALVTFSLRGFWVIERSG